VAGGAILGDAGAVFGCVAAVVAAEAAWIAHVADVIWMRSPGDFHVGEDILTVEGDEFRGRGLDLGAVGGEDAGVLGLIEGLKLRGNLLRRRIRSSATAGFPCGRREGRG